MGRRHCRDHRRHSCSDSYERKKKHCKRNFYFDAVGDLTYLGDEVEPMQKIIDHVINKECPLFTVHVGDAQPDTRQLNFPDLDPLAVAIDQNQWTTKRNFWYQIKSSPVIFTPGDNDWADTIGDPGPGPFPGPPPYPPNSDPLATLQAIRDVWYPETNAKKCFKIISQAEESVEFSEYKENRRWCCNGVVFVTIHTISGNNGLSPINSPFEEAREAIIQESEKRIQANAAWLNIAFDIAEKKCARGLVIMTHANPFDDVIEPGRGTGYYEQLRIIRDRSIANLENNLQVLFLYGDTHQFAVNKLFPLLGEFPPYRYELLPGQTFVPNITCVQVPGSNTQGLAFPDRTGPGRVKIEVDFKSKGLFKVYSSLTTV